MEWSIDELAETKVWECDPAIFGGPHPDMIQMDETA